MARLEQFLVEAARETPDRCAVRDAESAWSYAELDARTRAMTERLRALHVQPGARVAVWASKCNDAVAVMQAVLRLGAIYVPIDPATPAVRATQIIDDCDVAVIATTAEKQRSLPTTRTCLLIDEPIDWPTPASAVSDSDCVGDGSDIAFILYTSGSTGRPKGVCITHRNALAFVDWAVETLGIAEGAVFANHAAFTFDLSVFDLYGAFRTRSAVCLVPDAIRYNGPKLVEFLRDHRVSVFYAVPSAFILMINHGKLLGPDGPIPAIAVFAGEPFPIEYVRLLRAAWPHSRLFNFYGPTETNVCTAFEVHDVPADRVTPVPIGVAACGNRIWTVAEDGALARPDQPGEVFVDGPTVMRGYWGHEPHAGPYATGDIAIMRADGNYEFLGRRDHMIKIRGHRVEPAEIEVTLRQHEGVREVVVLPQGEGVQRRLVAVVVPQNGVRPTLLQLKAFSALTLPPYMVVDRVEVVDTLPLTANGKVDRLKLTERLNPRS